MIIRTIVSSYLACWSSLRGLLFPARIDAKFEMGFQAAQHTRNGRSSGHDADLGR